MELQVGFNHGQLIAIVRESTLFNSPRNWTKRASEPYIPCSLKPHWKSGFFGSSGLVAVNRSWLSSTVSAFCVNNCPKFRPVLWAHGIDVKPGIHLSGQVNAVDPKAGGRCSRCGGRRSLGGGRGRGRGGRGRRGQRSRGRRGRGRRGRGRGSRIWADAVPTRWPSSQRRQAIGFAGSLLFIIAMFRSEDSWPVRSNPQIYELSVFDVNSYTFLNKKGRPTEQAPRRYPRRSARRAERYPGLPAPLPDRPASRRGPW